MAANDSNYPERCPFWSVQAMKCQLSGGGLFIPLDDHIEVYCKTLNYPQCMQYAVHSVNHLQLMERNRQAYQNRRKYERFDACYRVTLVRLVQSGQIASHFSTIGMTLDLSMGGMRLTTDKPLISDTIVQFSFEEFFPENLQDGTGQIAWCNKQIDEPGYQVGISFQDDHLIDAMGLYLEHYYHS